MRLNLDRLKARFAATVPSPHPMRDWKRQLRINNAASRLAPLLYAAHQEMGSFGSMPWSELTTQDRMRWIQRAAKALEDADV